MQAEGAGRKLEIAGCLSVGLCKEAGEAGVQGLELRNTPRDILLGPDSSWKGSARIPRGVLGAWALPVCSKQARVLGLLRAEPRRH